MNQLRSAAGNVTRLICGLLPVLLAGAVGCGDLDSGSAAPDGSDSPNHGLTTPPQNDAGLSDMAVSQLSHPVDLATPMNGKAAPALQTQQRYFPDSAPWYRDISKDAPAADSAAITTWMVAFAQPNGWGGGKMQVDFSIVAVEVPPGTAKRVGQPVNGYFYSPDCDTAPIPVPPGGAVEETYGTATVFNSPWSGYNCPGFGSGADCHMLFVARGEQRLYEIYHATIDNSNTFHTGCLAVWDTTSVSPNGRGQQCTSADAAGFPIAPLLFTAEELAAGHIDHAIRFILPNSMIRKKVYAAPATHGTNTGGPVTSGPYGFRMRLKANYAVNTLSPAAQVVARAMQKYGMLLADGGNVALTAQSDLLSSTKYAGVGLDSHSLSTLKATDFDVIADTPTTPVTFNCQRKVITQ